MKKLLLFGFGLSLFSSLVFVGPKIMAEDVFDDVCAKAPNSTVCQSRTPAGQNPLYGPDGVITAIINLLSIILGIVAVVGVLLGGLKMITSSGNPQEVSKGRSMVLYAVIALIVAALAQVIVQLVLKNIG